MKPIAVRFLVALLAVPAPVLAQSLTRMEQAFPTGERASSVIFVERMTPAEVRVGENYDYILRVTNLTRTTLSSVVLHETISANFKVTSSTPAASDAKSGTLTWQWPQLAAGASQEIKITGSTGNMEDVTYCAGVAWETSVCSATKVVAPKLAIQKAMPESVTICDPIPVRIGVTNPGTGLARGVKVVDELPAGLTTTDGKTSLSYTVGDLAAGQSREASFTLKATKPGSYTNAAKAIEAGGLTAETSTHTLVRQPVLELTKNCPKLRFVGRDATFELTVSNTGDMPAKDTVITDTIPPGVELVNADSGGTREGGTLVWRIGSLEAGQAKTVKGTVRCATIGKIRSNATAKAFCAEATANCEIDVQGIPAILLECVDDPDPIEIGAQSTYTITVTNQGSKTDTNIVVECELADSQDFVKAAGATTGTASG